MMLPSSQECPAKASGTKMLYFSEDTGLYYSDVLVLTRFALDVMPCAYVQDVKKVLSD